MLLSAKMAQFWHLRNNLYIAIQPNPSYGRYVVNVIPKKLYAKKREKVTEAFLRLALPLLKVDAEKKYETSIEKLN